MAILFYLYGFEVELKGKLSKFSITFILLSCEHERCATGLYHALDGAFGYVMTSVFILG